MNTKEQYVKLLVEQLTMAVKERGFESYEKTFHGGGRDVLHRWSRIHPWKKDIIQLVHAKDNPCSCRIDFQVYLTLEDNECFFTGISISDYKRHQFDFTFPTFFGNLKISSTVAGIIDDVIGVMEWFNKYDKKHCLELIREDDPAEHIMISKTGRLYPAIEQILLSE